MGNAIVVLGNYSVQIQSSQPSSKLPRFSGYAACPLKNIYLQVDKTDPFFEDSTIEKLDLLAELQAIGQQEGFRVKAQIPNRLCSNPSDIPNDGRLILEGYSIDWGQDNKTFLMGKSGLEVGAFDENLRFRPKWRQAEKDSQSQAASDLAKTLGLPLKKLRSVIEGGNLFLGRDNQGNPYALLGEDALHDTEKVLRHEGEPENGIQEKAFKMLAEDLNVAPSNLHIIPQPNFHLDVALRPLNYPVVLLHDPELSQSLLHEAMRQSSNPQEIRSLSRVQAILDEGFSKRKYATVDEVEKSLQDKGFQVIRVPGVLPGEGARYGNPQPTNLLNAIVHQRPNGELAYLTNESQFPTLNRLFEAELKKKVPQVKTVYFVAGRRYGSDGSNYLGDTLQRGGGLHCLTTEEPDFDRWA